MTTARAAAPREAPLGAAWWTAAGLALGWVSIIVGAFELRWLVGVLLALGAITAFLAVADRERLLATAFVLSLQADVTLRLFYGKGGSDGLALPLAALAALALAGWWLLTGRALVWRPALLWPAVAVVAASVVSLANTRQQFVGLAHLLFDLQLLLVFWVGANLVRSPRDLDRVVALLMVALGVQAAVYALQSALGVTFTLVGQVIPRGETVVRPGGTVSVNPAGFSSFVVPLLAVGICRLAVQGLRFRPALVPVVAAGVAAVGLTATRAAWAAVAIAVFWVLALGSVRRLLRPGTAAALALALALGALAFAPRMTARLEGTSLTADWEERAGLMEMAKRVIARHPVLGVGPGAYPYVYKEYLTPELTEQWLYTVHNEFLLRTAETGVPGGLAWVVLLLAGFRLTLRLTRRGHDPLVRATALGTSAGMLAVAWQMYWVPWRGFCYNALLWFLLGLTAGAARLAQGRGSTEIRVGAAGTMRGGGVEPRASSAPRSGASPAHGT